MFTQRYRNRRAEKKNQIFQLNIFFYYFLFFRDTSAGNSAHGI